MEGVFNVLCAHVHERVRDAATKFEMRDMHEVVGMPWIFIPEEKFSDDQILNLKDEVFDTRERQYSFIPAILGKSNESCSAHKLGLHMCYQKVPEGIDPPPYWQKTFPVNQNMRQEKWDRAGLSWLDKDRCRKTWESDIRLHGRLLFTMTDEKIKATVQDAIDEIEQIIEFQAKRQRV